MDTASGYGSLPSPKIAVNFRWPGSFPPFYVLVPSRKSWWSLWFLSLLEGNVSWVEVNGFQVSVGTFSLGGIYEAHLISCLRQERWTLISLDHIWYWQNTLYRLAIPGEIWRQKTILPGDVSPPWPTDVSPNWRSPTSIRWFRVTFSLTIPKRSRRIAR